MLKDYFQFARNNRHFLLFGLLTAFFGNYGQSFFIAWFGQSFQDSFNLSNTEYGMIYSSATLVSGFIILWVGALLDKTPLKRFTLATTFGLFSACILLYFSKQAWHLVIAIFLLRTVTRRIDRGSLLAECAEFHRSGLHRTLVRN